MSETTKILVISDVHGRLRDLRWVLDHEEAEAMFYLGDGLYDLNAALQLRKTPVPYPIYRVAGNCDTGYEEPTEGMAPFAGVLFFYTHGWRSRPGPAAPMWRFSATPMCGNCSGAWARRLPCSIPAACGTAAAMA